MPIKHIVAVYGSLKKGFYNHPGLGTNKRFVGYSAVNGGMLLRHNSYPVLYKPTEKKKKAEVKSHVVELYEIEASNFRSITIMEEGAGYYAEEVYFVLDHPSSKEGGATRATIYWADPQRQSPDDVPITAYTQEVLGAVGKFF